MTRLNGYLDSFVTQTGWRQHGGFWSGISVGDTIIQSSGLIALSGYRNITLQVLGGSGGLQYMGGAYEGWQVKMANMAPNAGSGFNGFFPLAISGMYGMQDVFASNPDLMIQTPANPGGVKPGNMTWITNDRKFFLVQGQRAPLTLSGVLKVPIIGGVSFNDTGDLVMCHHAQVMQANSFSFPATSDEADARSLGPGVLTLNTGSGIINMSTGSGIAMITAKQDVLVPYLVDNWARMPMSGLAVEDKMFSQNTFGSGINFMCDGMYLVNYHLSFRKLLGVTSRTIATRAVLRNKGLEGEGGAGGTLSNSTGIPGSLAWTVANNVTTLPLNSASATFLVNASVGQVLGFEATQAGASAAAGQDTSCVASGSYAIVQYIGPKRTFPVLA